MDRVTMLTKLLKRNADPIVETPEGKLWMAVIQEALKKTSYRRNVEDFFQSKMFDAIANLIGLDPTFARESIVRFDEYMARIERER